VRSRFAEVIADQMKEYLTMPTRNWIFFNCASIRNVGTSQVQVRCRFKALRANPPL